MSLLEELESVDKKGLFKSNDHTVSYPTGITVLDYANGYWSEAMDPKTGEIRNVANIGVPAGSIISVIGYSGCGKAVPNSTLIPTPKGYRKVGSLKEGEYLFDRHGRATKIIGVYPQGEKDIYRIEFSDGRTAKCNDDHIWSVWEYDEEKKKEVLRSYPLKKIISEFNNREFMIPLNKCVDYQSVPISIHPWVLGVFIAKGVFTGKYLELSIKDIKDLPDLICDKMNWDPVKLSKGTSYRFVSRDTNKLVEVSEFLKDCPDLINVPDYQRFIPDNYLYNSALNRKAILGGMLDASGSIDNNGKISYSTTSKSLKMGIIELAYSLGYICQERHDVRDKYIRENKLILLFPS